MHPLISIALPLAISGTAIVFLLTCHLDIIESNFERSRGARSAVTVPTG